MRIGAIIATSVERDDDSSASFFRTRRVPCVRGPLENVAARFQMAAESHGLVNLELWLRELDFAARRPQPAVESVAAQLTAHN